MNSLERSLVEKAGTCHSYAQELRKVAKVPLLMLDDFGLIKLDASERLALLEIQAIRFHPEQGP